MSQQFPDLEIYLKRISTAEILKWLGEVFDVSNVVTIKSSTELCLKNEDSEMSCVVLEKAAKGGYVSVWIKDNATHWHTDKDFAEEAYQYFVQQNETEVRCSTGGWEGEDEGGWFRITDEGSQKVNWF